MKNTREFLVKFEKEIKVPLDMDKYSKEILQQISDYWGLDKGEMDDEEIILESAKDIAHIYLDDGYLDNNLEGFPPNGQDCEKVNSSFRIEEIK